MKSHDGLSEYVSRKTRVDLVTLLVDEVGSRRKVGGELGVSHSAIIDWLDSEGSHPSNAKLREIIDLALEVREEETLAELKKDLARHHSSLRKIENARQ